MSTDFLKSESDEKNFGLRNNEKTYTLYFKKIRNKNFFQLLARLLSKN